MGNETRNGNEEMSLTCTAAVLLGRFTIVLHCISIDERDVAYYLCY